MLLFILSYCVWNHHHSDLTPDLMSDHPCLSAAAQQNDAFIMNVVKQQYFRRVCVVT